MSYSHWTIFKELGGGCNRLWSLTVDGEKLEKLFFDDLPIEKCPHAAGDLDQIHWTKTYLLWVFEPNIDAGMFLCPRPSLWEKIKRQW